jgi:inorganic triphosphatase YgiF
MPARDAELKLEVPADSFNRLARSSLLQAARKNPSKPATLVSIYFDTDKLKLRNKGLSLQVRRIGRRHVQTIKLENGESTIYGRNEWEHPIAGSQPELDVTKDPALGPVFNKNVRRGLKPIFETRVRRRVYPIRTGDSEIELTVDKGKVEAGRQSAPLCELELGLKRGESAELFKLARMLAEEVPVQLAVKSKAERGYALIAGDELEVVKAAPVALAPDWSRQAAFKAIARSCLHQLVANKPATLRGDPEGVHQMRVALRRLRAAISLFADMLLDPQTGEMKSQFKWITQELGPARELDVFIKRVVRPVTDGKPNGPGMAVLAKDLQRRRDEAFARARAAIESTRFRDLVLDVAGWIEAGEWTRSTDDFARLLREQPIAPAAADELRRRWKKILKAGAQLDELDPPRRHKMRIQAKKLRYASEFFGGAFPGKKAMRRRKVFVVGLEKLQDALGDLNDIAVHERLSERIVDAQDASGKQGRAKKAFAAGRLSGREEARIASVLKDAQLAYHAFAKAKPFWP